MKTITFKGEQSAMKTITFKGEQMTIQEPEKVMRLSETKGMLYRLAKTHLIFDGCYYCTYKGKRTQIIN